MKDWADSSIRLAEDFSRSGEIFWNVAWTRIRMVLVAVGTSMVTPAVAAPSFTSRSLEVIGPAAYTRARRVGWGAVVMLQRIAQLALPVGRSGLVFLLHPAHRRPLHRYAIWPSAVQAARPSCHAVRADPLTGITITTHSSRPTGSRHCARRCGPSAQPPPGRQGPLARTHGKRELGRHCLQDLLHRI